MTRYLHTWRVLLHTRRLLVQLLMSLTRVSVPQGLVLPVSSLFLLPMTILIFPQGRIRLFSSTRITASTNTHITASTSTHTTVSTSTRITASTSTHTPVSTAQSSTAPIQSDRNKGSPNRHKCSGYLTSCLLCSQLTSKNFSQITNLRVTISTPEFDQAIFGRPQHDDELRYPYAHDDTEAQLLP